MNILDDIILSANKNKEYKYEDYKNTKPNDVEITTIDLRASGTKIVNPVTVVSTGSGGSGLGYVVLG